MSVFLHRYSKSSIQEDAYQEALVKIAKETKDEGMANLKSQGNRESKLQRVCKVKTKTHSDNSV